MITAEDLQPESIIMSVFTLRRKVALVQDSYESLLLKMAVLVFSCLVYRILTAGLEINLLVVFLAGVCCLLIGLVLMAVLELLSKICGTRNLLFFSLLMAALVCLIIIA